MCNCNELPESISFLGYYDRNFEFQGKEQNSKYFQEIDSDSWEPELEYGDVYTKCMECGQYWYFQTAPEESTFPLFGMKYRDHGYEPTKEEVTTEKNKLCILAHGGKDTSKCRMKGCNENRLKGREFCEKHITFP